MDIAIYLPECRCKGVSQLVMDELKKLSGYPEDLTLNYQILEHNKELYEECK
jgi:hypothetical protein